MTIVCWNCTFVATTIAWKEPKILKKL